MELYATDARAVGRITRLALSELDDLRASVLKIGSAQVSEYSAICINPATWLRRRRSPRVTIGDDGLTS